MQIHIFSDFPSTFYRKSTTYPCFLLTCLIRVTSGKTTCWLHNRFYSTSNWSTSHFYASFFFLFSFILHSFLSSYPSWVFYFPSLIYSFLSFLAFLLSFNHSFSILHCHSEKAVMWYTALLERACGHPGDFRSSINSPFRAVTLFLNCYHKISPLVQKKRKKTSAVWARLTVDTLHCPPQYSTAGHMEHKHDLHLCVGVCMHWDISQLR